MKTCRFLWVGAAIVMTMAATDCGSDAAPVPPSPSAAAAPTPRIATSGLASIELVSARVVTPTKEEQRAGLDFAQLDVVVNVSGVKLDASNVGTDLPNIGTWWAFIDDKFAGVSMSDSLSAPSDMVPFIAKGRHTVRVELRDNFGAPRMPAASVSAEVESDRDLAYQAAAGPPSVKLLQAAGGPQNQFRVLVGGVRMDGAKLYDGGAGYAEWRLFLNDVYVGLSVTSVMAIPTDLMDASFAGYNTVRFELYGADSAPFDPPISETKQMILHFG
jgi:hypothetical protein